jgi:hypothetical protein
LTITAVPVDIGGIEPTLSVDQQVECVAARVNEMIMAKMASKKSPGISIQHFN